MSAQSSGAVVAVISREHGAHGDKEAAKGDIALEARDDGKGASRLLQNYVDHVLHKEQSRPLTHIPLDRLTDQFHQSSFEEKLESIELRSIPYKSQMSIQRSLVPHLSTAQKKRFMMITQRIKEDDPSLIQVKLSNEGIDDFVLFQLCSGLTYNTRLQGMILHGNSITDEGVKRLCAVLCCHPRFHTLWLSANKFSDIGMRHLSKLITKNHNIKELNLSNRWPSQVWAQKEYELHPHVTYIGAEYLAQSLRQNSQLTSLSLADQRLRDDGAILLFEALPASVLRSLSLAANELTNRCCSSLRTVLSLNPILEKLVLSKNQLSDEGAIAIAHGLVSNALLKTLDISDNAIGDKGMVILSRVVERNQSLESLITVGNPSHDHRAELVAATRNNSVFAKTAAFRRSILVELKSINEDHREIGQVAVLSEQSLSRPATIEGGSSDRRAKPLASFAEMNVSPFRKTSRQTSILVPGVEAHGRKGLTRSMFMGDGGAAPSTAALTGMSGPSPSQPSILDAIAMAVSAVNNASEVAPMETTAVRVPTPQSPGRRRRGGSGLTPPTTADSNTEHSPQKTVHPPLPLPSSSSSSSPPRTPALPAPPRHVRRSQDLGKTLGIPHIQHIGVQPVRTKVSDYGDSNEHVLYLRIATEADPPDARPTSLVRIGLDHRKERARVCAERQSLAYKKSKALLVQERPFAFKKVTAPLPVPKHFWRTWKKKMDLMYPKGIDHSRGCTSTHLDPVRLPGHLLPPSQEAHPSSSSSFLHPPPLLESAERRMSGEGSVLSLDSVSTTSSMILPQGTLASLPEVVHAAMDRKRRKREKKKREQQQQRDAQVVGRIAEVEHEKEEAAQKQEEAKKTKKGAGKGEDSETDSEDEEEIKAAQRAALQALYDPNDVQSPWNRYVAFKEDALQPEGERKLGYYRHLGFTARSFTPGQVLAARRKERAIQLGLIQENSVVRRERVERQEKPSKTSKKTTSTKSGAGRPSLSSVQSSTAAAGKKDYESTKLVLSVASANRLS